MLSADPLKKKKGLFYSAVWDRFTYKNTTLQWPEKGLTEVENFVYLQKFLEKLYSKELLMSLHLFYFSGDKRKSKLDIHKTN